MQFVIPPPQLPGGVPGGVPADHRAAGARPRQLPRGARPHQGGAEIVTLIAHTDPASAVGAGGQQAEEQRGVGAGELPPAAQVQPGHLQVGERAEPGGGAGHVQPHHEDETGDHGANVVTIVIVIPVAGDPQ